MFGRIFGLDGRESYRELRLQRMLPSPSKPRLLRMTESIHAEGPLLSRKIG